MKIFYVTFFVVLLDQITKILVKGLNIPALGIKIDGMHLYESFSVIGDFFRITYIENPGMAFGIDLGASAKLFLTLFSLFASIAIAIYLILNRNEQLFLRLPLALILGGAIGNLIDRMFYGIIYGEAPLFYGSVVDFLDMDFFNITILGYSIDRWPIFNIADMSVTIGVISLLLFYKEKKEEPKFNDDKIIKEKEETNEPSYVLETEVDEKVDGIDERRNQ